MKYFYAKIDSANKSAEAYLNGRNEIFRPAIPIYFNCEPDNEADFLLHGNSKEQGRNFFECGKNNNEKIIIVINAGWVRFLKPAGAVVFKKSEVQENSGYVKLLPVDEVACKPINHVPPIMAGIAANRYYSSGTFREIRTAGNILAVRSLLDLPIDPPKNPGAVEMIECLGSFEFETLVAKIFEESGCFVPAYHGGNMQGVDIFARNDTDQSIEIGKVSIAPHQRASLQVKLQARIVAPQKGVDYLVAPGLVDSGTVLSNEWLNSALSQSPKTLKWLSTSLSWLPKEYHAALFRAF